MNFCKCVMILVVQWVSLCVPATAETLQFPTRDGVALEAPRPAGAMQDGEAATLAALGWEPGEFVVELRQTPGAEYAAELVYPSPQPAEDAGLNRVVLRWYPAKGDANPAPPAGAGAAASPAPAVLLVHSLHPDMPVATMLARGLSGRGVHAFILELPGYGSRRAEPELMTGVTTLLRGAQAVTDTRRGYDVIRAMADQAVLLPVVPRIDPQRIAVQGTSLGSFVAAAASATDRRFSETFLLLSGGDGVDILNRGQKDAFHLRNALRHYGYDDLRLAALLQIIEPLTLAHRLEPATTWMFNASDDVVIPRLNADRLADAIGLEPSHRVWMPGNHYTSFLLLPGVLERMCEVLEDTR